MELPTTKNLPVYIIVVSFSAVGLLFGAYVKQGSDHSKNVQEVEARCAAEIAACHAETREATKRLEEFLKEQAARDRALADEIRRLKTKKQ